LGAVINLKDANVRTPDQVLRVFFGLYSPGTVELGLWKAFGGLAVRTGQIEGYELMDMEAVAILFDQLIALVRAIDVLKDDPPERCPVCGRREDGINTKGR